MSAKKYFTEEERRIGNERKATAYREANRRAKQVQDAEYRAANRAKINARRRDRRGAKVRYHLTHEIQETIIVPPEVWMERNFRLDLDWPPVGDPPLGYASAYAVRAWRQQRMFAAGTAAR